jgi:hypothetical protein
LNKLGMTSGSFSWGGRIVGGSSKGRILLWLLFDKCVFPFCHRGFWVLLPASQ